MNRGEAICPLCGALEPAVFHNDRQRAYLHCDRCSLVFVPAKFHVSEAEERARYDLHENSPEDEGYRKFLARIVGPLVDRYPSKAACLEFGCGPEPVLAQMLEEKGFTVTSYDPFYQRNAPVEGPYDVITATEVVEHLRTPGVEFERLSGLLNNGGTLALMTRLRDDEVDFGTWHYKNDNTHICFYDWTTIEWIAKHFGLQATRIDKDIIFLRKD